MNTLKLVFGILFLSLLGAPLFFAGGTLLAADYLLTDSEGYYLSRPLSYSQTNISGIYIEIPIDQLDTTPAGIGKIISFKMMWNSPLTLQAGITSATNAKAFLKNITYAEIPFDEFLSKISIGFKFEFKTTNDLNLYETTIIENSTTGNTPTITWFSLSKGTKNTLYYTPQAEHFTDNLALVIIASHTTTPKINSFSVSLRFGIKLPIILWIGIIFLTFGLLFSLIGIFLIVRGITEPSFPKTQPYYPQKPSKVVYHQTQPSQPPQPQSYPPPSTPQKNTIQNIICAECGHVNLPDSRFCAECGSLLLHEKTATITTKAPKTIFFEKKDTQTQHVLLLASFGDRILAWLIDIVLLGLLFGAISSLLALISWISGSFETFYDTFGIASSPFIFVSLLYWTITEYYWQASIGKKVLNLKVVNTLTGERPELWQVFLSALGKAFFLPIDIIIGWLICENQKNKPQTSGSLKAVDKTQRFTQILANVAVIKESAPAPPKKVTFVKNQA